MAAPTVLYTYQSVGNREDLIDIIVNIDPVDTWFTSNTGSGRAKARYHEWQTDALLSAGENITVEGADATAVLPIVTTRAGNVTQILRKVFQISDSQESIDKAGRDSEIGYQKAKHLKELARDIEYALIVNSASATGASATARKLKGALGWISTNVETGTGTGNEALTQSMLNDALSTIWAAGGKPQNVLCGAFQKRQISGFTTNTREIGAETKTLVNAVNIFKSDFGDLMVRLHHQMNTSAAGTLLILGDMSLWNKAWLRPVKAENLARTGASTKVMIEAELTLESRQEKGSGKITGLTTS